MLLLILGLVIFLGAHSIRIFASDWRRRQIARLGEGSWKGLFALVSLVGLILIIIGFAAARTNPVLLYAPPAWLRHLNILLTLIAFVLVCRGLCSRQSYQGEDRPPDVGGRENLGVRTPTRYWHVARRGVVRRVSDLGDCGFRGVAPQA